MGIALPFLDAFGGNLTSLGMMACHAESVEVGDVEVCRGSR